MSKEESKIPTNRLSRFGQMASLATKIGSNVVAEGTKQWMKGNKPSKQELLLTPTNIKRLADQLAHLRGAAMKIGQMLSMDAGDLLSPELADILARLRSDANPMLAKQLTQVMSNGLGDDWKSQFLSFNFKPIASASIGQVHFAHTDAGDPIAVKVQYPGIRKSIDSDVDNVATLLNLVGLIPKNVDINGLLQQAKEQLHDEANYKKEAEYLETYRKHLINDTQFEVPRVYPAVSSETVLTMSYLEGQPIETISNCDQVTRDKVMTALLSLLFRELFEYQLVQTDPNFANYLFNHESKKIVLLDFGATRTYSDKISQGYQRAFKAVTKNDSHALDSALSQIGFFSQDIESQQKAAILNLVEQACEPMLYDGEYDFGASDLSMRLREAGTVLSMEKHYWHTPPADALFLHRKIGGLYLLAARLKAKVNVKALVAPYVD
ncbi:AarF/ABC1/UbiB kinase family protein [Vibrio coralliilyticus]|uniref:ABC1 kinase family protein n=1 Tax=Vibrio coralliilyticus TaxID=190893 RepID=UPI00148DEA09|nr:AarF/ABC1/UbiB kinase family protein [Vibrio coralliilyticus]NOH52103.1 AarF/ABC1/UbiB kinase family protein [Vibrio coralliilyticus]